MSRPYTIPLDLPAGEHILAVVVLTTGRSPHCRRTAHLEEFAVDGRAYARIMRHLAAQLDAVHQQALDEAHIADVVEDSLKEVLP